MTEKTVAIQNEKISNNVKRAAQAKLALRCEKCGVSMRGGHSFRGQIVCYRCLIGEDLPPNREDIMSSGVSQLGLVTGIEATRW